MFQFEIYCVGCQRTVAFLFIYLFLVNIDDIENGYLLLRGADSGMGKLATVIDTI